jgi:DNA-binding GntR family transcriptional regulator
MSHQFGRLTKDPMHEAVVSEIEDAIMRGKLKPGARLIEAEISDQFGVSRGPIREAMIELEMLGLIERIPYRGAVVTSELTKGDVMDLKTFRNMTEAWAAQRILEQDDTKRGQTLEVLEAIVDEMKTANRDSDLSRMLSLDFKFHNELIFQAGNPLLEEMWRPIGIRLRRYMFLNPRECYIPLDQSVQQHQEICQTIRDGDLTRTNALIEAHFCWIT